MGRSVMNIQPIQYNSVSMQGKRPDRAWDKFKRRMAQKVIDVLPSHTQKETPRKLEEWNKFDNWVSKPAQLQRSINACA